MGEDQLRLSEEKWEPATGDVVYVWNLEIARPEQIDWIGTIVDVIDPKAIPPEDRIHVSPKEKVSVLWNHGEITEFWVYRLAPISVRQKDVRHGGKYAITY